MENAIEVITKSPKKILSEYVRANKVYDFSIIPFEQKLLIVQSVPKDKIKTREIGGKEIPYVSHTYAQKILNFLFNFRVSNEVVSSDYVTYIEQVKNWEYDANLKKRVIKGTKDSEVIEAEVLVKFSFTYPDGRIEVRTVSASHKGFKNPAVTRGQFRQAAISKSWSLVARTFGVGADLEEKEVTALDKKVMYDVESEAEEIPEITIPNLQFNY